jgi:ABC-type enterochelin transport system permease subunit
MALALGADDSFGVAFLVAGGIVYEIIAFACSSPQTAEINIRKRGGTLMKWVHLGQALALAFIIFAAICDRRHRTPIILGGLFAMGSAEAFYMYAKKSGLEKPGPETEDY